VNAPPEQLSSSATGPASRARDEIDALLRISRALSGKLELPRVLGAVLGIVGELLGSEGESVLVIDPESGGMRFYVAEGPGAEAARQIPLPPGTGICGHCARTGEPLIVNDAQNDPRLYRPVDAATHLVTRNVLCVPIRSDQRLWGVLELINKRDDADFDQRDLRIAEVVATQTGLAMENARLHDQAVQRERLAAIGTAVSGLAHCIKNILNGIRSGSAVIDRAATRSDFGRVLEGWSTVRRNNDMLDNLVLDMLALARDSRPHPIATDVNELTRQVCGLLADRAAEREIDLLAIDCPALEEVTIDPTHFYRCLLNLVSNAVEAVDDAGHVRVRVHRGAGRERFTVSVADDGPGISPENQQKLFQEFFTTKGGKGTGLGLPVTAKLIREQGGRLTFHSVPGRGARFVFALPIEPIQEKQR
jgi:signal transduction histidine kinase